MVGVIEVGQWEIICNHGVVAVGNVEGIEMVLEETGRRRKKVGQVNEGGEGLNVKMLDMRIMTEDSSEYIIHSHNVFISLSLCVCVCVCVCVRSNDRRRDWNKGKETQEQVVEDWGVEMKDQERDGGSGDQHQRHKIKTKAQSSQEIEAVDSFRGFQSRTFSLTHDKRLVISSGTRSSGVGGRGRGRGRGKGASIEPHTTTVGVSRTVNPPCTQEAQTEKEQKADKTSPIKQPISTDQYTDATQTKNVNRNAPSSSISTNTVVTCMATDVPTSQSEAISTQSAIPSQTTSVPASKPKRYSSQRQQQKTGMYIHPYVAVAISYYCYIIPSYNFE